MDTVTLLLAKKVAKNTATSVATTISNAKATETKTYVDTALDAFGDGLNWKGEVDYYSSLPASPSLGDTYKVKYTGTSGTNKSNKMYAWGLSGSANTWIEIGLIPTYTDDGDGNITISEG